MRRRSWLYEPTSPNIALRASALVLDQRIPWVLLTHDAGTCPVVHQRQVLEPGWAYVLRDGEMLVVNGHPRRVLTGSGADHEAHLEVLAHYLSISTESLSVAAPERTLEP